MLAKKSRPRLERHSVEELTREITKNEKSLGMIRRFTTKNTIKQGHLFIKLKRLLKKEKFLEYNERTFPYLPPRTIQRYMVLAKHIELNACPGLAVLSRNILKALISQSPGGDVVTFLQDNGFDLDFDPKDFEECKTFITYVNNMVEQNKTVTKKQKNGKTGSPISTRDAISKISVWVKNKIAQKSSPSEAAEQKLLALFYLLAELLCLDEIDKIDEFDELEGLEE